MIKNHLLCIDLQTKLQHDALPVAGKQYFGILRVKLPSEGDVHGDQYAFNEVDSPISTCRRNVHLFVGKFITVTRRPDGRPRLNFRYLKIDDNFDFNACCLELFDEIREVLKMLLEK